ncbi:MAG: CheR family methyltransferase [Chitinispirillaceae bacterium]
MDKRIYDQFKKIVYEKAGIELGGKKSSLVSARVSKRIRELGMKDYKDYLSFLRKDSSGDELTKFIDVISTNVTSFFREAVHFEYLKERMAFWLKQGCRRFRFWSAACSSGEEPYTMAMVLLECTAGYNVDLKILATDISTRILKKALDGVYPHEKVKAIPPQLLGRYFEHVDVNGKKYFRAGNELRSSIVFRRINLSDPPFPMRGPMDGVFCRNVMIYFDNTVRRRLLSEIERLLKPQGVLFVGHAESLAGSLCTLNTVKPSIYLKK